MLYIYGMNQNSKRIVGSVALELAALVAGPLETLLREEIEKILKENPDLGIRKATTLAKKHLKAALPGLKDAMHKTVSVEDSTLSISVKPIVEAFKNLPQSKTEGDRRS